MQLLRALPFAIATATTASAQFPYQAVELMRVGDTLPGGYQVAGFSHLRTDDLGDWAALVRSTNPDPAADQAIVRNRELILAEGDIAPGTVGEIIEVLVDFDLNDDGHLAIVARTATRSIVYFAGGKIVETGTPISGGGLTVGGTLLEVFKVNAAADGRLLLRCSIADPAFTGGVRDALLALEVDASGAIVQMNPLGRTGDIYPGQTERLLTFRKTDNALSFLDDGRGTWAGELEPSAALSRDVAYFTDTTLLYQGGTPAGTGARTWRSEPLRATASSLSGSTAFIGRLDQSDPTNDEVLVVDGMIYAREGSSYAPFQAAPRVERIDRNNLFLTDDGRPVLRMQLEGTGPMRHAIVRAGEIILQGGDLVIGTGDEIESFVDSEYGFHCSDDGRFLIAQVHLDSGDHALVFREDELGEPYCIAAPNTTGVMSRTHAVGSAMVSIDALGLVTTNAPPGEFAHYVCGNAPDDVPNPGGSDGRLCVGGSAIGRYVAEVDQVDTAGRFFMPVDLSSIPTNPIMAVVAGDRWHFQLWHRDMGPGGSNFSLPVRVEFR